MPRRAAAGRSDDVHVDLAADRHRRPDPDPYLDPQAAKEIRAAVSALANDPQPTGSTPLGSAGLRRLRLADVRVLYEVDDVHQAVHLLTIGQVRR